MNKKIFTLFLVVAASAIFAVSCNNKTTNPTSSSANLPAVEVKAQDVAKALKSIGSYKNGSQTWEFGGKFDSLKASEDITGTGDDGATSATTKSEVKAKIESALKAIRVNPTVVVSGGDKGGETKMTFKITIEPADSKVTFNNDLNEYKTGKAGCTIGLTPASTKNWK
ncbi:hypothetical protein SZ52_11565 [Brachyspira hyodysenteriae]|uniref:SmpB n=1 Tax=Brachyspira hyodysenteriae TaxID=159 RepID=Q30B67_BRAHO|nr:hypothetical protein [Brachyspira hyodysenteriae]ABB17186.1 SmpB [Brachyspira hyodysenteriae]KLI39594.1 hypothetical protein SZ52_11565 [Brachyspira hyodysenteriae]